MQIGACAFTRQTDMLTAIAPIIGSILYRLRGGWLNDLMGWGQKTQASRAVWAIPTAAFMWEVFHLPAWMIAVLSVSVFASMALVGTGDYLDPKRTQPILDPVGVIRNGIGVLPLAFFLPYQAIAYALTGLTHAQIYRLSRYLTGSTQLAEFTVGGLTWLTIAVLRYTL